MANLKSLQNRFKDIQEDVPEESDIEQIMSQEAKERVEPTPAEPVEFPNVLSLATEEFDEVTEEPLPEITEEVAEPEIEAPVPARPPLPVVEKEEPLPPIEADEFPAGHPEIDPPAEEKAAPAPAPAKKRQPRGIPRTAPAPVAEKPARIVAEKHVPQFKTSPVTELMFFKEISAKIISEAKETVKPDGIDSDLYWDRILDIIENH